MILARLGGLAVCAVALAAAIPSIGQGSYVPNEVLVGTARTSRARLSAARSALQTVGQSASPIGDLGIVRVRLRPGVTMARAIAKLRQQPGVRFVEPNVIRHITATPNDTRYSEQWGLPMIQADLAWGIWTPAAASPIVIAIVDTGVNYNHPDLTNMILRQNGAVVGFNSFTYTPTNPGDPMDDHGHGTHCAGIAAGQINNGTGIAGVAGWTGDPAVTGTAAIRIMPIKALDSSGQGSDANVADGINYAVNHGANVLSMSFGDTQTSNTLNTAIQDAWSKGCVLIAAAGNSSSTALFYPAALDNVVSVAATDSSDARAWFSNYGAWVKVAAPGLNILSTIGSDYQYLSGTSMAGPHVAGEATLLWAQRPDLTNQQIVDTVVANVDKKDTFGIAPGAGRINVFTALSSILVPTLASLSPASALAGDPALTLTVNGTNFISGAVVLWNGSARTTAFASSSQVTAAIPTSDLVSPGVYSVTVRNPSSSGGLSAALQFTVTAPNPMPTLSSIAPDHAAVGDPGFVLTVTGGAFIPTSQVRWNGVGHATTYVSDTQLTATIDAPDIAAAGTAYVTVFSPGPGGGTSNSLAFTIDAGTNNPVPTLSSLNPSSAQPGSAGFTLTVTGSAFASGAVVRWEGSDRATTFVSATTLTAQIPASDLSTAGTAAVTAANPAPGGGGSNAVTFTIGDPKIIKAVAVQLLPSTASIKSGLGQAFDLWARYLMSDNSTSDWIDVTALGASFRKQGRGVMVGALGNTYQSRALSPETAVVIGTYSFNSVSLSSTSVLTVFR